MVGCPHNYLMSKNARFGMVAISKHFVKRERNKIE
jgi:hypothetical protein